MNHYACMSTDTYSARAAEAQKQSLKGLAILTYYQKKKIWTDTHTAVSRVPKNGSTGPLGQPPRRDLESVMKAAASAACLQFAGVRLPSRHLGAPLHFGRRGGCASSRLDRAVDPQASRLKIGSPSGFERWFSVDLVALAAKFLI